MEYEQYKLSLGAALAAAIQRRTGLTHHQCRSIQQSGTCIFVEQDNGATLMVVVSQVPEKEHSEIDKKEYEDRDTIHQDKSYAYPLAFYASLSNNEDERGHVHNTEHPRSGKDDGPY